MTTFNPFLVSLAVALLALAIVVSSRRRSGTRGLTPVIALALSVVLVPFGIAFAALWGPPVGVAVYAVLLTAAVIALSVVPGSRH